MSARRRSTGGIRFRPLTLDRWADFETLFGPRGACAGCWCMWWKLKRSDWERRKGSGTKRAMKAIVRAGTVPGLIAYAGGEPAGWIAVEPRERYSLLERSRILQPLDDRPVWSITCFFVRREHRGRGLSVALIEAAVDHVRRAGGTIVEAYPVQPKKSPMPPVFAATGLAAAFLRAGFRECARRSETRPIMRRRLARKPRARR